MDRRTEAVDVFCIFKPVFFVSKVLGLSPYNAAGDIGNRRIVVTVSAIIYSLGMAILNVGGFAYGVFPAMFTWRNICSSTETFIYLETLGVAVSSYFTCLLGCRQTARQFERLDHLIGKTYYSVWRKDLQLLLAIQMLCVILIVTGAVLDISQVISQFYYFRIVLAFIPHYVSEFAGFMSEHQFVVFLHILKRAVQSWNNHIYVGNDNDELINNKALHTNLINGQKSVLFTVSKTTVNSNPTKIHSKVVHFQQFRELHASACDIAESVNAIYSPVLLMSVARSFTSLTHILYYILVSFIVQKTSFFCKLKPNESYFVKLIINSLRLIWLVYFAASTAKEVSQNYSIFSLMFVPCIIIRSRNNHQYALICTTSLPYILATLCFGSNLQSSGSFLHPSELLQIQIESSTQAT
jgi:hypothetical protein